MPNSRGRKQTKKGSARRRAGAQTRPPKPSIGELVKILFRDATELAERTDPLDAESWASRVLGMSYKMPVPFAAREEFDTGLRRGVLKEARRRGDVGALAVLRALAIVEPEQFAAAADELAAGGIAEPIWWADLRKLELVDCWVGTHPFDDQDVFYSTWRYPGCPPHVLSALYDRNIGGIIKDAFAGYPEDDPRSVFDQGGMTTAEIDPGVMAARVIGAITTGDMFIDNHWTQDFKDTRALLFARMKTIPAVHLDEPDPLDDADRDALFEEFLASPHGDGGETTRRIVDACLNARCDYGDGDPFRWSPIVVELFMADYLPRKEMLGLAEIRALPETLKRWIRFALGKRGLTEDLILETEEAVDRWTREFKTAATDQANFGPAKSLVSAMMADGVDPTDQGALDAWIDEFNQRPFHERDQLLGPSPFDP